MHPDLAPLWYSCKFVCMDTEFEDLAPSTHSKYSSCGIYECGV